MGSTEIDLNEDVEEIDRTFREVIIKVARQTIPKSRGKMKKRAEPWWTDVCSESVREIEGLRC